MYTNHLSFKPGDPLSISYVVMYERSLCSFDISKARTQKSHLLKAASVHTASFRPRNGVIFRRRALQKSCKFGR